MQILDEQTLESLVAVAHQKARRVVSVATMTVPGTSAERAIVLGCIRDIESNSLLGPNFAGALSALSDIAARELATETLSHRRAFEGHHDPEAGSIGGVTEVAVLTARGEQLSALMRALLNLDIARSAAVDRLRAEKEIRRHL